MEETNLQGLQHRLAAIEERNARVEVDKAWETSICRMSVIATLTYLTAVIFLFSAGLPHPFLNAAVPTVGFVLSMQSLPFMKQWWVARRSAACRRISRENS